LGVESGCGVPLGCVMRVYACARVQAAIRNSLDIAHLRQQCHNSMCDFSGET